MTDVLLLGAGKIGAAISELLTATGDYSVTVGDSDEAMLDLLDIERVRVEQVDATKPADLRRALKGRSIVISALPFYLNPGVAEAARAAGCHYFDLTEDVETTKRVRAVADGAPVAFVPQCGLAPGFISIVGLRSRQALRQAAQCLDARRRSAAIPRQRAQIQSDLEHRRPHQRILQSVRRRARRPAHRGAAARGPRELLARRRRLRGVQHLGRPGHAGRDAGRQGREPELQDRALSRALRDHEDAGARPAPGRAARAPEERARDRGADDQAGRRAGVRLGARLQGRAPDPGDLRQEDLQPGSGRPSVERHPDHHGGRRHRHGRPAGGRPDSEPRASCARRTWRSTTSSPTASGAITRETRPRAPPNQISRICDRGLPHWRWRRASSAAYHCDPSIAGKGPTWTVFSRPGRRAC